MKSVKAQRGFTLIELILVIVILGIMSVSIAQVVSLSAQIYITGADRTRLVSQARFVILRLEKELRNIVPNSVAFDSSLGCLSYYPIKQSGTYVDDAFDNPMHVVIFDSIIAEDDTLVVYPTSPQSVVDNGRNIDSINSSTDAPSSSNQFELTLDTPVSSTSPGKRFFVPEAQVSICQVTNALGNVLTRSQGGTTTVLATDISQWNTNIVTAGLRQNGLVEVELTIEGRDNETLSVVHEIHFPNVP
ncbi:type II secretion system protein [Alteromonas sp. 1_MG-2023]|jgi:MSHA biogenesis protein MshO|uniref:PulJ/GspJ family protein n=1 Tax=Alteromonas sp. 1_MG-2023 TaxID=3062669 RepID=UPI0026E35774|nr:type II secretion system protein [Alteromonas sp. 1_MG-2023]MDO6566698.1 type II secretion system protein [Alteromonas sp. 1_MG-2023]